MRRVRIIQSQSGSNFFQPAEYAAWRSAPAKDGFVAAPRKMERQR